MHGVHHIEALAVDAAWVPARIPLLLATLPQSLFTFQRRFLFVRLHLRTPYVRFDELRSSSPHFLSAGHRAVSFPRSGLSLLKTRCHGRGRVVCHDLQLTSIVQYFFFVLRILQMPTLRTGSGSADDSNTMQDACLGQSAAARPYLARRGALPLDDQFLYARPNLFVKHNGSMGALCCLESPCIPL